MAKYWNAKKSFNPSTQNGVRYFNEFKQDYPTAEFLKDGDKQSIANFSDWEQVRTHYGISGRGSNNPETAGIAVIINGKVQEFSKIRRKTLRDTKDGSRAANLETMVSIAALTDIKSYADFVKWSQDRRAVELTDAMLPEITEEEISAIIDICEDDPAYADAFISAGRNMHKILRGKGYRVVPKSVLYNVKNHAAKLMSLKSGETYKADKWNPADICFVKGVNLDVFLQYDDIVDLNLAFNEAVQKGEVIPVSIKQKPDSIKGSRGITGELKGLDLTVPVRKYLEVGTVASVPVKVNVTDKPDKLTDEASIQRSLLAWCEHYGKEHIERTAAAAIGLIPLSSVWYLVNDQELQEPNFEKRIPELKEIIVSLVSKAVWFKFDICFLVGRTKGAGIQLTADAVRKGSGVKDWKSITDVSMFGHLVESEDIDIMDLEQFFLSNYPEYN